jgi:hypothetical protein
MAIFKGNQVNSKEHVDHIVKKEIIGIFGSAENEAKYHRLALRGLYLQANPQAFGGSKQADIISIREKVLPKFLAVEKIVEEGNVFCKSQGWTH